MKTFTSLFLLLCITIQICNAQDYSNYFQIRNNFYQGYAGTIDTNEASPLNQFRKSESIWGPKFSPTGSISNAAAAIHDWNENYSANSRSTTTLVADWKPLGPFKKPTSGGWLPAGTGRLNCIALDPISPNTIMYAGTPFGGVWKTNDGGQNWFNLNTDFQLPLTRVSDIAINPSNPNMIFIATGDRDDYQFLSPSAGVYRSSDGGQHWYPVNGGLNYSGFFQISKILINPSNPDEVYLATSTGIYKTTTATTSCYWVALSDPNVYQKYFRNIIFKPNNLYNTIYASGKDILKSTNGGNSWTSMTGPSTGLDFTTLTGNPYPIRINIEVSAASPNVLYASLIMSNNSGQLNWNDIRHHYLFRFDGTSWSMKNGILFPSTDYGKYAVSESWLGLAVSPVNSYHLFLGNVVMWRTLDGGSTPLTQTYNYSNWNVHPDVHDIKFSPDGQTIYLACDGGFYKLTNPTSGSTFNWEDLNNGLAIGTITKIGGSQQEADLMLIGEFDCSSNLYDPVNLPSNTPWKKIGEGDGCEQAIDYTNSNIMYSSSQKNNISRSINRGVSWSYVSGPSGETNAEFIADFILHPINPNILYCDFTNVHKLTYTLTGSNWTSNWLKVSNFHSDYFPQSQVEIVTAVASSETSPGYLYNGVLVYDQSWNQSYHLFKSTSGGYDNGCTNNCWTKLYPPNPHYITGIAVSSYDPNKIWISYSGYDASDKVKMFNGTTWINYSNGLPNQPINNIIVEKGWNDGLYVATDIGVYYRNSTMSQWEPFMTNLPNVAVSELEINYLSNKIKAGTYGRGLWESPLACSYTSSQFLIQTNTTWNSYMRIDKDVVVKPGITLNISSTAKIAFLANQKLIIEPGAKLIINGAILTSACESKWQGIQVWGNKNASQLPDANGNYQQGYLELNNATIENAVCAVDLWKPGDYLKTGGILKATNSTFRNNTRSIHANHYKNIHPYNGSEMAYFGRVKNCVFEITGTYIPDQTFYKHVDMADIKGFTFEGSDFSLAPNVAGVSDWNQAIAAYSAGFSVQAICTSATQPCSSYDKCKFTGFRYGIFAKDAQFSVNTFTVNRTEFENNIYGINVLGIKNETILNSDFKVGYNSTPGCPAVSGYGIYLDNSTGFAIEENTFTKMPNAPVANYTGIHVNNSQGVNDIYKNSFSNLSFGNSAYWTNWTGSTITGLEYLCNTNQSNWADFYVPLNQKNENNIQSFQGSYLLSAGNIFSQTNNTWHFYNGGGSGVTYHYIGSSPLEPIQTKLFNVAKSTSNASNQCPSHYGGDVTVSSIVLNAQDKVLRENQYAYNLVNYNNVKTLHDQLRDGGSTQERVSDIETAQPQDMWALRTELLGVSPHLSEEVLRKVADKTDVFSESIIFDILAANPDELKKEELLQYLENKENPLPSYMIDILRQVASGETYRTVLEKQMSMYRKEMTRAANDMIRSYLNDSVTDYNALRGWLDNLGGIEADRQIIATYVQEGNYQQAIALANMLPTLYTLTGDALSEHERYMTMLNLYQTLQTENRHLDQLTTIEKALLEDYANNSSVSSGVAAKSILATYYNAQFVDCMQSIEPASLKKGAVSPEDMAKIYGMEISVKPNPASDWAAFDYTLPDMEESATLQITDMTGKIIETFTLTGKQGQKLWDTRPIKPGVYLYTMKSDIKSLSGKITIIR
ncbi:MAG: T9SS type A sorting domain-containing protein [Lentimicrobium sp.]|nr:T9SS type A sorting domain-containing protein [Lentimicrobium sp.]